MRKRPLRGEKKYKSQRYSATIHQSPSQEFQGMFSRQSGNMIFCRYCEKERDSSQEFYSRCGRNAQTASTNMKQCVKCKSLMTDDSNFCANCGGAIRN
jgi:hypothetical protein